MFWRFGGYANISTLDSILDKPDVTLEELLEESDLIQEVKAQNAKLIEFLRDEPHLERLLEYVTAPKTAPIALKDVETTPEDKRASFFSRRTRSKSRDEDGAAYQKLEDQRMRRAFTASEILSAEVHSIYEALFANPSFLKTFWDYVKQDAPLEAVQVGYWTKVNEALLEKRPEDMIKFIHTLDDVVPVMMNHVDNPMVMDLLLKLISLEKEPECSGIVDWLQKQNLIPKLLSFISSSYSAATQTSAGDFLKAIITISANATGQDGSVIGPNELTRQLVSEPCINTLASQMLKGGNPLTVGVGIIIEVIRKNNSDYDSDANTGPEPRSSDPIYLGTLLQVFAKHTEDFMHLILDSKHSVLTTKGLEQIERAELKTAWGERIEPLGFDRFKTCELMAELLHCSNMGLLNEKGSYAIVKERDSQREKLKTQGLLKSAQDTNPPQLEIVGEHEENLAQSSDSDAILSRRSDDRSQLYEGQDTNDDDGFEKVALSEAELQFTSTPADNADSEDTLTLLKDPLQSPTVPTFGESNDSSEDDTKTGYRPPPLFSNRSNTQPGDNMEAKNTQEVEPGEATSPPHDATSTDPNSQPNHDNSNSEARPYIETEDDGSPLIGDLLKINFIQHGVVPTILGFFFRFPWNNFLHNVVYDVVQQVFNGPMERGHNRNLALDLFETGHITDRIIEGQRRSDEAQRRRQMRLGYMGHLTLIAEEVVKFAERQPTDHWAHPVLGTLSNPAWIHYVENVLTETRNRDNAILGGMRPDTMGGPRQAMLNSMNAISPGFGNTGSAALADAGLTGSGMLSVGKDTEELMNAGHDSKTDLPADEIGPSDNSGESINEDTKSEEGTSFETGGSSHFTTEKDQAHNNSSSAPAIPAPLAIPPSRARRQLAARLAEKQRLATGASAHDAEGLDSEEDDEESDDYWKDDTQSKQGAPVRPNNEIPSGIAAAIAAATLTATAPITGASRQVLQQDDTQDSRQTDMSSADSRTLPPDSSIAGVIADASSKLITASGSTASEGSGGYSLDEDDDDTQFERELAMARGRIPKQALERRPLDIDSDEDENMGPNGRNGKTSLSKDSSSTEESEESDVEGTLEDPWKLNELRMGHLASENAASGIAPVTARDSGKAWTQNAQENSSLERRFVAGRASEVGGDQDDSDEDEDDLIIGGKYLKKGSGEGL